MGYSKSSFKKPNLDCLNTKSFGPCQKKKVQIQSFDVSNLRRKKKSFTYTYSRVKRKTAFASTDTLVITQKIIVKISRKEVIKEDDTYLPNSEEIKTMKTKFRERHRSEMLKPSS